MVSGGVLLQTYCHGNPVLITEDNQEDVSILFFFAPGAAREFCLMRSYELNADDIVGRAHSRVGVSMRGLA